jgi:hypothetical protein
MEEISREQAIEIAKVNGLRVPNNYRNDKEVMLEALKTRCSIFEKLDETLYDDKDIALIAVSNTGQYLWRLSDRLIDDKEVVLAAVSNDGEAFRFASKRLKDDKEVAICAISKNPSSFYYASDNLRQDIDLVQLKEETAQKKLNSKKYYTDSVFGEIEIDDKETTLEFEEAVEWLNRNVALKIAFYKVDFKECFDHFHGILSNMEQWDAKIKDSVIEEIKANGVWNDDFNDTYNVEELYSMLRLYYIEVNGKKITFCFKDGKDSLYGGHDLGVYVENNEIKYVGIV